MRGTFDPVALEDIYLPYKQKRKTKAQAAREAGLEPLAEWLWACGHGLADAAGETPEARAREVRRRGEGDCRRDRGAGRRRRHRDRTAVGGRGPAPAGARRVLRARLRPRPQGREGQDAEPVRELLRVPGADQGAAQAAELAPLPGDAARVAGGRAGADAGRAAGRRRQARRRPAARRARAARSRPPLARRPARRSRARRCSSGRRAWPCART